MKKKTISLYFEKNANVIFINNSKNIKIKKTLPVASNTDFFLKPKLRQSYIIKTNSPPKKITKTTKTKITLANNNYEKSNILVSNNNNKQNINEEIVLTEKENISQTTVTEQTNVAQPIENNNYNINQLNQQNNETSTINQSYSQKTKIKKTKINNKISFAVQPKKEKQNLNNQSTENIKNSVVNYLQLVKNKISANITFPESARQLKFGEKIIINITLNKNGNIKKIKVVSGNNNIFIEYAKEIVIKSAPFAEFPKEIANVYNELNINIPINFKLKEE